MSLKDNLKNIRKEKGYTLEKLSEKIGYSPAYISQVENGKRENPSKDFLYDVANGLGVSTNYILTGQKTLRDMSEEEAKETMKGLFKIVNEGSIKSKNNIKSLLETLETQSLSTTELYFLESSLNFLVKVERENFIDDDLDLLTISALITTITRYKDIALDKDVDMNDVYKNIEETTDEIKSFLEIYYGVRERRKRELDKEVQDFENRPSKKDNPDG